MKPLALALGLVVGVLYVRHLTRSAQREFCRGGVSYNGTQPACHGCAEVM